MSGTTGGVIICPLCDGCITKELLVPIDRLYYACGDCGLVFLDCRHYLSSAEERARYLLHENDLCDPGYREFLERLAIPVSERVSKGAEGLDFGSGPEPALASLLETLGFRMKIFDPFFSPSREVFGYRYDFITSCETFEHLRTPGNEIAHLNGLLRPGGWLGVMTEWLEDEADFGSWRYRRDPTHVAFFRRETLEWIASRYGWSVEFPRRNVALFQKSE